jgi:hypothetical protein
MAATLALPSLYLAGAHSQAVVQAAPDDSALKALQAQMAALQSRQDSDAATAASAVQTATSAQITANAAATPAQVSSAVAAATPADCPAPLSDALVATAGSATRCMPKQDAQRATQVQSTTVTTASDGSFTGMWPVAFASTPTGRVADIEISAGATTPYKCSFNAGGVTATGFNGKCWQLVATTLPTTATALLGLTVSPITNAAANLTVRVIGRQ